MTERIKFENPNPYTNRDIILALLDPLSFRRTALLSIPDESECPWCYVVQGIYNGGPLRESWTRNDYHKVDRAIALALVAEGFVENRPNRNTEESKDGRHWITEKGRDRIRSMQGRAR